MSLTQLLDGENLVLVLVYANTLLKLDILCTGVGLGGTVGCGDGDGCHGLGMGFVVKPGADVAGA